LIFKNKCGKQLSDERTLWCEGMWKNYEKYNSPEQVRNKTNGETTHT
jgi:hypothetical protein